MKTWVKWYAETNHDPDIGSLTWAQRGIWAAMCALCGEVDARDERDNETGELDTPARIAWHLRIDTQELRDALSAFATRGMIEERDGVIYLPNYPKRQSRAPSSSRDAVAERVKRHRAKNPAECNEDVTRAQRGVTPTEAEAEADTEKRQNRIDAEAESDGSDVGGVLSRSTALQAWEQVGGGLIGPMDRDMILDMTAEAEAHRLKLQPTSPGASVPGDSWVAQAIREANASKTTTRVSINYVKTIIGRWYRDGYMSRRTGAQATRDGAVGKPGLSYTGPDGKQHIQIREGGQI